jgi:hypothetical protein
MTTVAAKYLIQPSLDVPVFARIHFPAWIQRLSYNIAQKEGTTLDITGAFCLVALPNDWYTPQPKYHSHRYR